MKAYTKFQFYISTIIIIDGAEMTRKLNEFQFYISTIIIVTPLSRLVTLTDFNST